VIRLVARSSFPILEALESIDPSESDRPALSARARKPGRGGEPARDDIAAKIIADPTSSMPEPASDD